MGLAGRPPPEGALSQIELNVSGMQCLTWARSTGGFTDVLDARRQPRGGVDVGHGQLHDKLSADERVVALENVNALASWKAALCRARPEEGFDLIVADLSFIALSKVVPHLGPWLKPGGQALMLIKPQFEVGKGARGQGRCGQRSCATCACPRHGAPRLYPIWAGRSTKVLPAPSLGDGNLEFFIWAQSPLDEASLIACSPDSTKVRKHASKPDCGSRSMPVSSEFPPVRPKADKLAAWCANSCTLKPEALPGDVWGRAARPQDGTIQTVRAILAEGLTPRRTSCIGASRPAGKEQLAQAFCRRWHQAHRGPRVICPVGYGGFGEFRYASELVAYIREATGDHLHIEVGACPEMHPQAKSPAADLQSFCHQGEGGVPMWR